MINKQTEVAKATNNTGEQKPPVRQSTNTQRSMIRRAPFVSQNTHSAKKISSRNHGMRPSRPPESTQVHKKVEDVVS